MKHTLDELLDILYRYYPRGIGTHDQQDTARIRETEEHARLVAARREAATDERWHALRRRISERFPEAPLMNYSLHLPTGQHDACYSFTIDLPGATDHQGLWFQVSFLAPYYIVFSSRLIEREIVASPREFHVVIHGQPVEIPVSDARSGLLSDPDDESLQRVTFKRRALAVAFDLSPDEQPYAAWIAREIEATFGCEPMPPQVGTALVPDVATGSRRLGEARLYDCLFSDRHPWVEPLELDARPPALEIDASRLTDKGLAVATVLAALIRIISTVIRLRKRGAAICVEMDEGLGKDTLLGFLALIRQLDEPPQTPRDLAAKSKLEAAIRELEALIAAWDGDGVPPDAMVAWASRFLADADVGENEAVEG